MRSAAIIAALVCIAAYAIYHAAGGDLRERELQEEINTIEGIQDAQDACPDDMSWWLRNECLRARDL